jgi:hypothetical protein
MGSLGADIPDLSSFKNVWDKPRNEQHDVWVAPVHQHEPQIMTKPEYSHYNADDYEPDRYYLSIHTEFHPSSPAKDHWHQHEEQHHHEEYHHRPEYPPSLPWDHVSDHFPPPTRVWLDESTGKFIPFSCTENGKKGKL